MEPKLGESIDNVGIFDAIKRHERFLKEHHDKLEYLRAELAMLNNTNQNIILPSLKPKNLMFAIAKEIQTILEYKGGRWPAIIRIGLLDS